MNTTQQVALVTGATSGIGEATARAFAKAGFAVVGTGRRASTLTPPAGVTYVDLDVTSDVSVAEAVEMTVNRFGRIDVLVNNAGLGAAGAVEEHSIEQSRTILDINVLGVIRMTKAVLPQMRDQGVGRIINVSSVLGVVPQPFMAIYVASKHAVEGYSESLDHEVREFGVRSILIQPAYTKTSFEASATKADSSIAVYSERRRVFDEVMASAMQAGDSPEIVAQVIVAAATDAKPKLRYTAGPIAARTTKARRYAPSSIFDVQIRKLNRMPV